MHKQKQLLKQERNLFFRRWLKHPTQMGTMSPVSNKLADLLVKNIKEPTKVRIVEIGPGTGRLTRAMLNIGVKPENLLLVELDQDFCNFLNNSLPNLKKSHIIQGDAAALPNLVPSDWIGHIDYIVSAVPLMYLPKNKRQDIFHACFHILKVKAPIIHVTYNLFSPMNFMMDLEQICVNKLWLNLPPAFVWCYSQKFNK